MDGRAEQKPGIKSSLNDVMKQLTDMSRKLEKITSAMYVLAEQAPKKKARVESAEKMVATKRVPEMMMMTPTEQIDCVRKIWRRKCANR